MERYQYEPLPLVADGTVYPFTRLLTLLPGQPHDPLRCFLVIVNAEQAPAYEALSYVWGASTGSMEPHILCEDKPVSITPNLATALKSLRYTIQGRLLWIDAICIDQQNIEERSRQVDYMRLIYEYASHVVAWLGPKSPGSEHAFNFASRLARLKLQQYLNTGPSNFVVGSALLTMTESEQNPEFCSLCELLDSDYFTRVWCIQEVVVSKACIAKCGDLEMNLMDLVTLVPFINARRPHQLAFRPLEFWVNQAVRRELALQKRVDFVGGSLLHLLCETRDFKATDARDKIFALSGISLEGRQKQLLETKRRHDNGASPIQLARIAIKAFSKAFNFDALQSKPISIRSSAFESDYNKPVEDIYRDLSRFIISRTPRELTLLSHVQHIEGRQASGLPSWVPNWSQSLSANFLAVGLGQAGMGSGHYFRYFANLKDSPMNGTPVEPNKLRLQGFRVDRILQTSEVMKSEMGEEWPAEKIWQQLFKTPLFHQSATEPVRLYRTGYNLNMAFCLTAMAFPLSSFILNFDAQDMPNLRSILHPGNHAFLKIKAAARADAEAFILTKMPTNTDIPPNHGTMCSNAPNGDWKGFHRMAKLFTHNRRFYTTRSGYMGLGPMAMQPGDEVCVLFGGQIVFILRPVDGHHVFIGEAYIMDEEIMGGKATDRVKMGKAPNCPVVNFELL